MLKTQQQASFLSFGSSPSSELKPAIHDEQDDELGALGKPTRMVEHQEKCGLPLGTRSDNTNNKQASPRVNISSLKRSPSAKIDTLNSAPKEQIARSSSSTGGTSSATGESEQSLKERSRQHLAPKDGNEGGQKGGKEEAVEEDGGEFEPPGDTTSQDKQVAQQDQFKAQLVWRNVVLFIILHSSIPIGIWMLANGQVSRGTLIWALIGMYSSGLGVTGGAHRLWSHRAYKARWPVQVLLMILQTMAGQNSIYTWSRDHRVHHKYSETNADPHNIKRGFFFAHMGWLCCRKHPDVKEKGALIDMSDLEANPVVMFQHRNFWWLAIAFTVLVPTYIPVLLWQEKFWTSFVFSFMLRYLITLHGTWLVNSAAHYFGSRPYDKRIEARESPFVILTGLGEGFHNYHHTFPFDYSTSEFGKYFNITTAFIDLCASLGLVTDRRSMSASIIEKRQERTGDGSAMKKQQKKEELQQQQQQHQQQQQQQQARANGRSSERLVNNLIHELPYISGLTTMKYTM